MAKAKHPIKRGNRYDRFLTNLIQDWTADGLEASDGHDKEKELIDRTPDYAVAVMANDAVNHVADITKYARLVVYHERSDNNADAKVNDNNGGSFTLPGINASRVNLATGFIGYLHMDEQFIYDIDVAIIEANKPPAARHVLPSQQLTGKEKADPNFKGEGAKTKKG